MTSESTHLIRDSHSTSESTHLIRDLSQHQCVPHILLETNHRTSEIHTSYWRPLTRTVRSTHLIRDLSHDQCSPGIALVVDIVQPLQVGSTHLDLDLDHLRSATARPRTVSLPHASLLYAHMLLCICIL